MIDNPIINPALAIGILDIIQEALVNSIKYANCDRTNVLLQQVDADTLLVVIEDKGIGFEQGTSKSHSYGLKNMHARATEIAAEFAISSQVGEGTRVELKCNLK